MTIVAAADGSALGNPGPAGWAWYVDDSNWRAGGWPHGTNNQGELMAVLDLLRQTAHLPHEDLQILCDSQYVINCITKWMPGWKRKGWRKADGKPVLNVELLKDIDRELVGRRYAFTWVKGHAGHDLNEAADERARAVATAYQQGTAAPTGPGFIGSTAATRAAASSAGAVAGQEINLAAASPGANAGTGNAARVGHATVTGQGAGYSEGAGSTLVATTDTRRSARDNFALVEDEMSEVDQLELFGPTGTESEPRNDEEPDLFSVLESEQPAVRERPAEDIVVELERELLRADVRADPGRTGVLLHPDFTEIGASGRLWTRDAMMMALVEDPGETRDLELLGADRIGENAILLNYRSYSRSGTSLRSSLWILDGGHWRLRFHQGTPEKL
ncbi:ribonuclease HI family protein [Arthrobacter sp. M4]|uniref:ribonuclease HI family protein n=1 Tax=Arthrobacter sp. M4 TaxID=218160 RepID=UPI001CDC10E7|nr:ribonuclease HI family protein [Arthrobacter sp. M4]MCA4133815.1 ribonuclease HI family protein [Arthrobacter sp. M4]